MENFDMKVFELYCKKSELERGMERCVKSNNWKDYDKFAIELNWVEKLIQKAKN